MTRNQVVDAVLARLTSSGIFLTSGRRLLPWPLVSSQPALFVRHMTETYPPRPSGMPAKVVMDLEAWVYSLSSSDPAIAPDRAMSDILDQLEALLKAPPGRPTQTLDGLVHHCWIEGVIDLYPGDRDDQAIAVVPVKVLVPVLQGN